MEEGRITDSFGRQIDFRNTILIMTSNIGANVIRSRTGLGFHTAAEEKTGDRMRDLLRGEVERFFRPEFLNRVDEMIYFKPLEKEDMKRIVDVQLVDVMRRLVAKNIKVELPDAAKDFLLEKGWSPEFGARPLRRAIERYLEDPLSEEILKGNIKEGDSVTVRADGPEGFAFDVAKPLVEPPAPPEPAPTA